MTNQLYSTSGRGVKQHKRTIGKFQVQHSLHRQFSLLEEAYEYFKQLNEEATLWDVTDVPELLESKYYL